MPGPPRLRYATLNKGESEPSEKPGKAATERWSANQQHGDNDRHRDEEDANRERTKKDHRVSGTDEQPEKERDPRSARRDGRRSRERALRPVIDLWSH
jgi:hypothetical protein